MKRFLFALLAIISLSSATLAQNPTGRLIGTVNGPDGVIPGASIVVTDNQTNKERTTTATDDGTFNVPQLEPGTYTVTISAPGFKTFSATELKIDIGREYSLNPTLEVGGVNETVTVTAGADILNSTNAEISNTISPQQVRDLPLNGRDPLQLIDLQAGVAGNGATSASINGQRPSATNITRDGINVQDQFIRESASEFSPARSTTDNISEFTVTTSNAGADQGFGASQVQQVTDRGQNEYNGAVFAYNRNDYFGANEFFNNSSGVERPRLNRNQFGGKVGGPMPIPNFGEGGRALLRDKGFFFFAYEELRLPVGESRGPRTILLPNARQGIFTYVDNSGVTRQVNLFDPRFGYTRLPSGRAITGIDPLIQTRILDRLPTQGNSTGVGDQLNTTGYLFNQASDTMRRQFDTRIDLDVNERHTINGVFSLVRDQNLRPDADSTQGFGATPVISDNSDNERLVLAWRATPSAAFTNEIRGGFFKTKFGLNRDEEAPPFYLALPLVSNPEVSFGVQGRDVQTLNFQDNAVYTRGNHSLRFGGQMQRIRINSFGGNPDGTIPTYTVGTSLQTAITPAEFGDPSLFPGGINTAQRARASNLLGLLSGIVNTATQSFNATREGGFVPGARRGAKLSYETYGLYAQDQWRVTPRLTLNLGLRYEIFSPIKDNNGSLLEVAIPEGTDPRDALLRNDGRIQFAGGNVGSEGKLFRTDLNNFAPNFSFAYSPQFRNRFLRSLTGSEGRTVIRGGYSVAFFNDEYVKGALTAAETTPGLSQSVSLPTLDARLNSLPAIPAPTLSIPRTFEEQRDEAGLYEFLFTLNPDLQIASTHQWNLGIQREVGWQTALEVRYVGNRSDNLTNIIDLNQLDIFTNGFVADFNIARRNLQLSRALNAEQAKAGVPIGQRVRITGAYNPAVAGTQQFTGAFLQLGNAAPYGSQPIAGNPFAQLGGLDIAGIQSRLDQGIPAQLALVFAANDFLQGNLRLRRNENAGQIGYLDNQAKSNYHSLQAEVRKRFSNSLQFQANYTFSKTLTNASGLDQLRFEPLLDVRNPGLEYTRADYDQTHRFNFNSIYELPFGNGKRFLTNANGLVDRLLGGFRLGTIVTLGSGAPITITDARSTLSINDGRQTPNSPLNGSQIRNLIGNFRTPCGVFFINPNVIDINQEALAAGRCNQLTTQGFTGRGARGFGQGTFANQAFFNVDPGATGTLPRAIANGPLYFNVNASLIKNIRIREGMQLQLRAEAFNVLNRTNFFAGITEDINSTTFGRVNSTFSPRVMQFAARLEF